LLLLLLLLVGDPLVKLFNDRASFLSISTATSASTRVHPEASNTIGHMHLVGLSTRCKETASHVLSPIISSTALIVLWILK
jgi:hypothetical protein